MSETNELIEICGRRFSFERLSLLKRDKINYLCYALNSGIGTSSKYNKPTVTMFLANYLKRNKYSFNDHKKAIQLLDGLEHKNCNDEYIVRMYKLMKDGKSQSPLFITTNVPDRCGLNLEINLEKKRLSGFKGRASDDINISPTTTPFKINNKRNFQKESILTNLVRDNRKERIITNQEKIIKRKEHLKKIELSKYNEEELRERASKITIDLERRLNAEIMAKNDIKNKYDVLKERLDALEREKNHDINPKAMSMDIIIPETPEKNSSELSTKKTKIIPTENVLNLGIHENREDELLLLFESENRRNTKRESIAPKAMTFTLKDNYYTFTNSENVIIAKFGEKEYAMGYYENLISENYNVQILGSFLERENLENTIWIFPDKQVRIKKDRTMADKQRIIDRIHDILFKEIEDIKKENITAFSIKEVASGFGALLSLENKKVFEKTLGTLLVKTSLDPNFKNWTVSKARSDDNLKEERAKRKNERNLKNRMNALNIKDNHVVYGKQQKERERRTNRKNRYYDDYYNEEVIDDRKEHDFEQYNNYNQYNSYQNDNGYGSWVKNNNFQQKTFKNRNNYNYNKKYYKKYRYNQINYE